MCICMGLLLIEVVMTKKFLRSPSEIQSVLKLLGFIWEIILCVIYITRVRDGMYLSESV